MQTLALQDGHTVAVYLSAHEVPIKHYVEFQHHHMRDVGIGSSVADVENHFAKLTARVGALLTDPSPEQATYVADEMVLMQYNFNFMVEREHPSHLAFGALVAQVDGQPCTDLTEDGLAVLLARLADYGLTRGQVEDTVAAFLKKKARELAELFPRRFGSEGLETQQYWFNRQARDQALADYMITREPHHLARIQEIDKRMLEQSLPDIFDDGDARNVLIVARQQYIKMCAALAEQYNQPENLTLVAFHGAIDYLTERSAGRSQQQQE